MSPAAGGTPTATEAVRKALEALGGFVTSSGEVLMGEDAEIAPEALVAALFDIGFAVVPKLRIASAIQAYAGSQLDGISYDIADPAVTVERIRQLYQLKDAYQQLQRDAENIAEYAFLPSVAVEGEQS